MSAGTMREAFEEALVAEPDEAAHHAAYADWLSEQPDPLDRARGEFVAVQLALEGESLPVMKRAELRRREAELLAAHQRQWLGELAPFLLDGELSEYDAGGYGYDHAPVFRNEPPPWQPPDYPFEPIGNPPPPVRFRRGWLDAVHVPYLSVFLARLLRQAPQVRLLRELSIDTVSERSGVVVPEDGVPDDEYSAGHCPLADAPALANVRIFRLGEDQGDDYHNYRCYLRSSVIPAVVRQMPRLEELRLFANNYDLSEILRSPTISRLRLLQVYHLNGVHRLQLLAENPAARELTHLLLHPHNPGAWWQNEGKDDADGYRPQDGYLPLSVVAPLLRSRNLPNLSHLRLRCSSLGDTGCREIVRSGVLRRLKSFDLRHGVITDAGARALAGCRHLRKLASLDLDRNGIGADGVRLLKHAGVALRIDDQVRRLDARNPHYFYEAEFE